MLVDADEKYDRESSAKKLFPENNFCWVDSVEVRHYIYIKRRCLGRTSKVGKEVVRKKPFGSTARSEKLGLNVIDLQSAKWVGLWAPDSTNMLMLGSSVNSNRD